MKILPKWICNYLALLAGIIGLGLPGRSSAATYTYTGHPFTYAIDGLTTANFLSGSTVLALPLLPNLSGIVVTPLSYSFNDGVHTVNPGNTTGSFLVSTDNTGAITAWDFTAYSLINGAPEMETSWHLAGLSPTGTAPDRDTSSLANIAIIGQNANNPGFWVVPEPASFTLLSLGLLGVLAAKRKR